MMFLCKFGQNPLIGSGDKEQTRLIFTVFILWWPWKLGQGQQNQNDTVHIKMLSFVDKTYCDKMLSEVFIIIIYVNKYAMTTCNKDDMQSCQTIWKKHNDMLMMFR